jgi:hypothetical protein
MSSSASSSFCEGKVRLRVHPEPASATRWCVLSANDVVWRESETSADTGRVQLAGCHWHAPAGEPTVFFIKGGPSNVLLEFTTSGADERAAWIDFLSSVAKLPAGAAPIANSASAAGGAAVGVNAAAKLSRAAAAKQERAKLDAAIAELIDEASACEDFENCVVYRQYKRLLTQIDAAVTGEQFEEAIKLRHEKKLIDDAHPEIALKRDSMPVQLVAATAPSTPLPASAVASPAPAPAAAASAVGGTSSSAATPVIAKPAPKKLTAAERDALWSKLVSKPAGAPANPGKRGSWDSGFTLQAASNADDSSSTSTEEMRPTDAGDKGEPLAAAGGTPSKPKTPAPGAEETTKKKKKTVVKKKKKKTDAGDAEGEEKKKKKKKKKEEDKDKPLTKEEKNKRLTEALAKAKKRAVAQAALNSTWGGNKKGSSQLDALFSKVDMGKK